MLMTFPELLMMVMISVAGILRVGVGDLLGRGRSWVQAGCGSGGLMPQGKRAFVIQQEACLNYS